MARNARAEHLACALITRDNLEICIQKELLLSSLPRRKVVQCAWPASMATRAAGILNFNTSSRPSLYRIAA
eukprot:4805979-Pleurochrysis_carterae.AAC.1